MVLTVGALVLTHDQKITPTTFNTVLTAALGSSSARLTQPVLWSCGWLSPTGCSSRGCPSAPGICPHICLTADSPGTDPRRGSPLKKIHQQNTRGESQGGVFHVLLNSPGKSSRVKKIAYMPHEIHRNLQNGNERFGGTKATNG